MAYVCTMQERPENAGETHCASIFGNTRTQHPTLFLRTLIGGEARFHLTQETVAVDPSIRLNRKEPIGMVLIGSPEQSCSSSHGPSVSPGERN